MSFIRLKMVNLLVNLLDKEIVVFGFLIINEFINDNACMIEEPLAANHMNK